MQYSIIDKVIQEEGSYVQHIHITLNEVRKFQKLLCEVVPGRYYLVKLGSDIFV